MKIFYLPDLGEGLAEAEIREWYVKEGDRVQLDQPLVSMETAKAIVDVPSPYTGKIINLHGAVNDVIKTGAPFITFELETAEKKSSGSVVGSLEESAQKWSEEAMIIGQAAAKSSVSTVKALPAARVLATQMGVDLQAVSPTGPNGLITPADVKRHLTASVASTHTPPAASHSSGQKEALHGVRRAMAVAMVQSHQEVVPVTVIEDADISALPAKSDMTVHLLKSIANAVKVEPALNAWFDGKALARQLSSEINIGLAVDTTEGLFVPVIKHVDQKTAETLRTEIDDLKQAVKSRSLAPSAMQGATITLSNFGMIAGRYATPIIVPPMVAILGCGRSREVPIVKNGQLLPGRLLPLSLTFDHRAVTGGEATRFLRAIIDYLQNIQV